MRQPFRTVLGVGAVAAFAVCDLCRTPAASASGTRPPSANSPDPVLAVASEPRTVTLRIQGMTCGGCAIAARRVLGRLDGVTKAEVNYETQRAVVTYDPDRVTVEQLIAAVKRLGYAATLVAG